MALKIQKKNERVFIIDVVRSASVFFQHFLRTKTEKGSKARVGLLLYLAVDFGFQGFTQVGIFIAVL